MYYSRKVWGVNFFQYLEVKNGVFGVFKVNKCRKLAFFVPFCAIFVPFLRCFCTFRAAWKAYLTSMTPSTTTPGPGTLPANSRCTKQFWSNPHGL